MNQQSVSNKRKYLQLAKECIPRILSLVDRDEFSPTKGFADRLFWGWKLIDFPDATLQRIIYPLAFFWSFENKENEYFHNQKLLEWIKNIILALEKLQHKNGSFDQTFPFEYSYGATAFILHDVLLAYELLKEKLSEQEKSCISHIVKFAAAFLINNKEEHGFISNHRAAAASALCLASKYWYSISAEDRIKEIIREIISHQTKEGAFLEYESSDPGYQSLCVYYLALCYRWSKSKALLESLEKAVEFLSFFVHPDGTFGGEYGSRNTEIFYPGGFETLRTEIPLAGKIADFMYSSLCSNAIINTEVVDAGNLCPLISNYIRAYLESKKRFKPSGLKLPFEKSQVKKFFEVPRIYIKGNSNYYSIMNLAKGGLIKVFDKKERRLIWDDCGFVGETVRGDLLTTQLFNPRAEISCLEDGGELRVKTKFFKIRSQQPSPLKFIILRLFYLTFGRNITLGNWMKKVLVKLLISGKKQFPIQLQRKVTFHESKVIISDTIDREKGRSFKWLKFGTKFSAIHMASSKYYQKSQLSGGYGWSIDVNKLNRNIKTIIELPGPKKQIAYSNNNSS